VLDGKKNEELKEKLTSRQQGCRRRRRRGN
jgi:hypothetical protein